MNDKVSDQKKTESPNNDITNVQADSSPNPEAASDQSTTSGPETSSAKDISPDKKQRIPVSKTAVLSLLVSTSILTMLGGGGWYVYKHHRTTITSMSSGGVANQRWVDAQIQTQVDGLTNSLGSQINRTESDIRAQFESQLQSQQASSSARADGIERSMVELRTQSSYTANRIDSLSNQLQEIKGADRNVWTLSEAEYLMRLANQRLITMRDIKSAQSLLTQAESLLVGIDEYGLVHVRQALANDIAALRGTTSINPTNTWLTLNTLASQIGVLPIVNGKSNNFTSTDTSEAPEDTIVLEITTNQEIPTLPDTSDLTTQKALLANIEASLQAAAQKISVMASDVGNKFLSQFLIRKDRGNIGPVMMSPDQEQFVRQSMQLMIEQAQLALLQGHEEVYQNSVNDIEAWLNQWFIADSTEVNAFHQALTPLLDAPITQTIPDISNSLNRLKIYVNEQLNSSVSASNAANRG